jgi:hypothetical protein
MVCPWISVVGALSPLASRPYVKVPISAHDGGLVICPATMRLRDIAPPPPIAGVRDVTQVSAEGRDERFR